MPFSDWAKALGLLLAGLAGGGAAHAAATDDCLLVAEPASSRVLADAGDCTTRRSPASTFKVALALMGFDAGILKGPEAPVWERAPGLTDGLTSWAGPQTPESWMQRSVVWYSQTLTRNLGSEKFADYVRAFGYGNADVVGDPGKRNGVTRAWLSSSLRISPQEQVAFLTRMLDGKLPVSADAVAETRALLDLDQPLDGWKVFGKTGSGRLPAGEDGDGRPFGWFVGFAQKGERTVVFARFIAPDAPATESLGFVARRQLMEALPVILGGVSAPSGQ